MLRMLVGICRYVLLGLLNTAHRRDNLGIEPPPKLLDTDRLCWASTCRREDLLRRNLLEFFLIDEGFACLFVHLKGSRSDRGAPSVGNTAFRVNADFEHEWSLPQRGPAGRPLRSLRCTRSSPPAQPGSSSVPGNESGTWHNGLQAWHSSCRMPVYSYAQKL